MPRLRLPPIGGHELAKRRVVLAYTPLRATPVQEPILAAVAGHEQWELVG